MAEVNSLISDSFVQFLLVPLLTGAVASLLTVWFSRRNLKTTKYIDTITVERIKWIQIVRSDFNELITSILIKTRSSEFFENLKSEKIRHDYNLFLTGPHNEPSEDFIQEYSNLSNKITSTENEINSIISPVEIVNKAMLIKLKMNPRDDEEIINDLNLIIDYFSDYSNETKRFNLDINSTISKVQSLLKREWDKVKKEVKSK